MTAGLADKPPCGLDKFSLGGRIDEGVEHAHR
jgi:hypothetical protein